MSATNNAQNKRVNSTVCVLGVFTENCPWDVEWNQSGGCFLLPRGSVLSDGRVLSGAPLWQLHKPPDITSCLNEHGSRM